MINSNLGGKTLESILRREHNIQVEMSDLYNIVLIGSVADKKEFYDSLRNALLKIKDKFQGHKNTDFTSKNVNYQKVLSLRDAYYMPKRRVKIKEAKGLISGEMVVPYPPGIPILVPGKL
ncbi:Orn/Lys/Arg family decarboxylase [Caloramator sp. Dgby_cultured_2]|uniref:Orn/Lys/Arg family decarboxylase n=1 Tax=Caloramator sp. Dgby_cultured_2 TaxID=3029174 RepID=UPI00237DB24A|nr:hypothetical protein [Caloramator sp. Dgby_cultured_2]WDU83093.1 hypothetical protein PWK10_17260 [Caloramator sp. Dgby_cultured_2]